MNPLSSIPPTPPQADPPSSPQKTVSSSPDSVKEASASFSSPTIDPVSLSTPPVSHYLEQMSRIPDVRQARITQIQEALASNSYVIPIENLADKLLQELPSEPQETRPPTAS